MILKLNIYNDKKKYTIMKYIKTYENFSYKVNEEFFGIGKKIKEVIATAKEISNKVVSKMTDEEKQEALDYMVDKGLTPEAAQETASKLKLETPDAAAEVIQDAVPEITEEEPVANESVKNVIVDRLIRFVANPAISAFLIWCTKVGVSAVSMGWADQPKWIQDIHDAIPHALHGWVSILLVFTTFIFCILTIVKMIHGRKMGNI
jgi:hypothetical protein